MAKKWMACILALMMLFPLCAQADSAWTCPNCGQSGNTGRFCPNCGAQQGGGFQGGGFQGGGFQGGSDMNGAPHGDDDVQDADFKEV